MEQLQGFGLFGIMAGVVFAVLRFAELAITKRFGNGKGDESKIKCMAKLDRIESHVKEVNTYHDKCNARMTRMCDLHLAFDDDGRPKWYVPKGLETSVQELITVIRDFRTFLERHDERTKEAIQKIDHMDDFIKAQELKK